MWDALWNARYDPSGAGLVVEPADQAAAGVMPTPAQFGCATPECEAMFTYVVWHEIARQLGFSDVADMQAYNPALDFSRAPVEGDVLQSVYADVVAPTTMVVGEELPSTIYGTVPPFGETTTTSVGQIDSTVTP